MEAENLLEVSNAELILEPPLTREYSYLELLKFKDNGNFKDTIKFECHSQVKIIFCCRIQLHSIQQQKLKSIRELNPCKGIKR